MYIIRKPTMIVGSGDVLCVTNPTRCLLRTCTLSLFFVIVTRARIHLVMYVTEIILPLIIINVKKNSRGFLYRSTLIINVYYLNLKITLWGDGQTFTTTIVDQCRHNLTSRLSENWTGHRLRRSTEWALGKRSRKEAHYLVVWGNTRHKQKVESWWRTRYKKSVD